MKHKIGSPEFYLDQIVGNWALSGIVLSSERKAQLLECLRGNIDPEEIRKELLEKYKIDKKKRQIP